MTKRTDRLRELLAELRDIKAQKGGLYGKGDTPQSRLAWSSLKSMSDERVEEAVILLIEETLS